jgi:hypothetical protein
MSRLEQGHLGGDKDITGMACRIPSLHTKNSAGRLCPRSSRRMGGWRCCQVCFCFCPHFSAAYRNKSTINHSNTSEELAFAIKIVKPKIIIVDAAVKKKLDEAVRLAGVTFENSKIMTFLSRVQNHPLVCDTIQLVC